MIMIEGGDHEVDKNVSEMTAVEILRQQLELLAEESKNCEQGALPQITSAMCEIFALIK